MFSQLSRTLIQNLNQRAAQVPTAAAIVTPGYSVSEKRFPLEPKEPQLKTSFPGPKTQAYLNDLKKY